jgi:hypothetical protein
LTEAWKSVGQVDLGRRLRPFRLAQVTLLRFHFSDFQSQTKRKSNKIGVFLGKVDVVEKMESAGLFDFEERAIL